MKAVVFLFLLASANMAFATNGTGVVTVTSNNSCLDFTPANGNGPDNWEVAEGGSYTMTITGVTECSGSVITVFVQNSGTSNWCFNATGGNGTYVGSFTMPSPTCNTSPISYKCGGDQDCSNANTFNADGPSGNGKVHFRSATFDGNCNATGVDGDCNSQNTCTIAVNGTDADVNCHGANNGSIDITVSGAQGAVDYSWNDGATSEDRNNLAPGTYTVTVTDDEGCSASKSFTITEPDALAISDLKVNVTYNGANDGSIDITVTGGTGSHTFQWNDGSTDEDRTNLAPGNYSVTVTDENGCTKGADFIIEEPGCDLSVDAGTDAYKCHGKTYQLNAQASHPNATYSWQPTTGLNNPNIANPVTSATTQITYTVTVQLGNCSASDEVTVTTYDIVKAKIKIVADNGTCGSPCKLLQTPYDADWTYNWRLNGNPAPNDQHTNTYCACESGDYVVKVEDKNSGCKHNSKHFILTIQNKLQDGSPIAEDETIRINAYPNPAIDVLNVTIDESLAAGATVELLSLYGNSVQIMNATGNGEELTFNTSSLSAGVYFIRVNSGNTKAIEKVVINK